jgi:hypothetical protein
MWLTARDDSLLAIPRIEPVKVFDSGGRRNTVVVKSLDFVHPAGSRWQGEPSLAPFNPDADIERGRSSVELRVPS